VSNNNSDLDRPSNHVGLIAYSEEQDRLTKTEGNENSQSSSSRNKKLSFNEQLQQIWRIYQIIAVPSFSVWFVFTVTIAIFPSLTVLVESQQKCKSSQRFFNDLFLPFLFLMFNVFDLCGRITAGATKSIFTIKTIWIGSLARLVFWPMFLFLNVSNSELPVLFASDAFPIVFMALMAFSNGYIASNAMMMGAGMVSAEDSNMAGTIMVFSLTFGLCMGAVFSFPIVYISQGKL
jgi:equilibrative nucleoside transporter 1/2/3